MKSIKTIQTWGAIVMILLLITPNSYATGSSVHRNQENDTASFIIYKGIVIDSESKQPLIFATLSVEESNIATVTNTEGSFLLKVPVKLKASNVKISYIGYESTIKKLSEFKTEKQNVIDLNVSSVSLTEINVFPNNARTIIDKAMRLRSENYYTDPLLMTAFYRETIKKRHSYVGIAEAVVQINKQPFNSVREDQIRIFKGRKSSDERKLDTLLFKLQGGPHSTLALDIVKDPYMILSDDYIDLYDFKIVNITRLDGKLNYVIEFQQKPYITDPLFYGKLYIDADKLAISSISFSLNTSNEAEASKMFIRKKPLGAKVYPETVNYLVNYHEKDGRWVFNYARGEIVFVIDWQKKFLNTYYTTMVEMAITDWEQNPSNNFKPSDRLKTNVVMEEAVSGFKDNEFWGEYNIIEPEQSIESAIKKIKKRISKLE